ncbi:OLC1v1029401C1 [Oldenlandia corymbosa var. corymbosa]|nr:OLC1v1029401C1 [Oldenlandia corymbosa var. corymbosa]
MESPSCSRLSIIIIIFTLSLLATSSWYITTKPGTLSCSESNFLCSSIPRKAKLSSLIIETPIPKPKNLAISNPLHPLDPLAVQEINRVRSILSSYGPFSSTFPSIHSLSLDEPEKSQVLRWKNGDPFPTRKALVIGMLNGEVHVVLVDLELGQVTDHEVKQPGLEGYPMITMEDVSLALQILLTSSEEFNKSISARGLDLQNVNCLTPSPGWFGSDEEGHRVIKIECFYTEGTPNFYMRPIEGLVITIDIENLKVSKFTDTGRGIPVPKAENTDYRFGSQNPPPKMQPINPISIEQPKGPSFRIEDEHFVTWANWKFHLKPDQRAGMVISQAMVQDSETGEFRSVMYKGFASELFVPYMDFSEGWYFKSYMDAGEYGLGAMALTLVPLNDCPRNSYFMDGVFVSADGKPLIRPDMICVFESYAGDVAWRHSEFPVNTFEIRESRPKINLVARMAASVGNYDYIIDWEFQMDGLIRVKVSLSGMLMVEGTQYENINQVSPDAQISHPLVSENVIGVIHDHFITFHLDMDVDGSNNSFVNVNLVKERSFPGQSPRKSILKAKRNVAKTEEDARLKLKLYDPSEFHFINPSKRSRLGNPSGYKVVPGANAASLLDLDDPPQLRAAFTNNQIWVTPYNRSEQWAGGLLVYQSNGEDTLAVWSNR